MFLTRTFGLFFLVSLTACWGYCSSAGWILILLSYAFHIIIPYNKGGHPLSPDLYLIGMASWQHVTASWQRISLSDLRPWLGPDEALLRCEVILLCSMPQVSGRCDLHPLNSAWERLRFRFVLVTGLVSGAFRVDDPKGVTPWMNLWSLQLGYRGGSAVYAYCFHVAWARMLPKPYGAVVTYGSIPLFYIWYERKRRETTLLRCNPCQGLSSWGSNLLGFGSLGGCFAEAAASIRSSVKEVKKSCQENLGTVSTNANFSGQSHQLQGVNGTPARDVAFLAEGAFGSVMKVSCKRPHRSTWTGETFALKKISCMEGVQALSGGTVGKFCLRTSRNSNPFRFQDVCF
eukprot:Skav204828  [mRNA]  locus=scaffold3914:302688:321180:+ [translate_table: standard]